MYNKKELKQDFKLLMIFTEITSNLPSYLTTGNFGTLALCLGMLVFVCFNRSMDKYKNNYFISYFSLVILLDVSDMIMFYYNSLPYPSAVHYFLNALGYTLRCLIPIIFLFITLKTRPRAWLYCACFIPIGLFFIIYLTSYWSHWVFYYSASNHFLRGPLGYLPYFSCYISFLIPFINAIKDFKRSDLGEVLTIVLAFVINIVSSLLEAFANIPFLIPAGMIIGMTLYYSYLNLRIFRFDALTGVRNRMSFYIETSKLKKEPLAIISVDFNCLKELNDSKGHLAGDEGLCLISQALIKAGDSFYKIYRIGGDEFTVIGIRKNGGQAESYIQEVKKSLSEKGYMASFGYASYMPGEDFERKIQKADYEMYKDKNHYKHRNIVPEQIKKEQDYDKTGNTSD